MRVRSVVSVALLLLVFLSGCAALRGTSTQESTALASGDRRSVSEPAAPAQTCATVTAQFALTDGTADDADEAAPPDTARIQHALDGCAQTADSVVAVRLAASGPLTDFVTAPLTLRQGEVLVLDSSVTLYASRNPADYQVAGRESCGTVGRSGGGCAPLLTLSGAHTGVASTPDAAGRQGRIDGRGGQTMLGASQSWWDLAQAAKGHGVQNVPRLVQATKADDVTLHDIDLVDAAGIHVSFQNADGLTIWGVRIQTPATARNTDGIDPAGATDVTIADSWIMDGDDGIAIKAGSQPSTHVSIIGNHLFGTHGISIGSETTAGVSDVLVDDDTVSGTDAHGNASAASTGIRIKSSPKAGGIVRQVTYRRICVDAVKSPIDIDPFYGGSNGPNVPRFQDIVVSDLRATNSPHGATSVLKGVDAAHPLRVRLENVDVDAPAVQTSNVNITASGVAFGGAALDSDGSDAHVSDVDAPSPTEAASCVFPPYPAL
ncbi:glycosyl hydrolase family 28 protein [Microbacterium sp. BG28]|uniref:glycoside hydrolase family 28 protein n=1 Tax=Microbacterium sp. BG28 TaxID=3097356 RepID=UPI002A5AF496|nr:glycosyl hydrolase family 28 protein [Microbacterium sp. BG28]MDY0828961.1 glycosyl hydrolase family 28 protein [Microbacterium sp. BG28]